MNPTRRRLLLASWHMDFCVGLFGFALTRLLAERGLGLPRLGLLAGIGALLWACVSLAGGRAADRLGRRTLVLAGAWLVLAGAVVAAAFRTVTPVAVGAWWLSSCGAGAFYPAVMAWLSQGGGASASGRRHVSRSVIRFCLAWNLGLVSGQLSAGALYGLGPAWPLALAVLLAASNLRLTARCRAGSLPPAETEPVEAADARHRALAAAFSRLCWIANIGGTFVVGVIFNLLPDLMVALDIAPALHGLMLGIMRVVVIATYVLLHKTRFWHYRISVPLAAHALAVGGLVLIGLADNAAPLAAAMALLGVMLGFNYFASLYYSSTGAEDRAKGKASGFHEATFAAGIAAGSMIGGLAGRWFGPRGPYRLAAALVALLALAQLVMYLRRTRRPDS
ncbi:MAG: MFS transporter [Lentisphaerae bacterium]|nr:MFS transporter [Lentisphaerota bacterium]